MWSALATEAPALASEHDGIAGGLAHEAEVVVFSLPSASLSDLCSASGPVLDLENMWSSVDTEEPGSLERLEKHVEEAGWAPPEDAKARCASEVEILPESNHILSSVTRSNPSSYGRGSGGLNHDGHESDTSETASEPDATTDGPGSNTRDIPSTAEQQAPPARCPFCGNLPIVPGQVIPSTEDRRPVGGVLEKGRYKVRAAPRKENRLAQW